MILWHITAKKLWPRWFLAKTHCRSMWTCFWYLLASLKKCHSPNMASSNSFWRVLVSVHLPFWRVFEKNGFPHWSGNDIFTNILKKIVHQFWSINQKKVETLAFFILVDCVHFCVIFRLIISLILWIVHYKFCLLYTVIHSQLNVICKNKTAANFYQNF